MNAKARCLHLGLIFCLTLGWAFCLPMVSPAAVHADDPQPPPPQPPAEETELGAALAALEAARRQGPEAVMRLMDTLRGPGLDAVMDDIQRAHEELARAAPPPPEGAPVSTVEEEATVQAQLAHATANRNKTKATLPSLDEDEFGTGEIQSPPSPNEPNADRTVGSPPCTYSTIAAAMTAANPGDRLLLEGGVTFAANLSVIKSLTFQGGYNGCGSGSTARTTLDGGGVGRVMYIYENLTITLDNLNIINGSTSGNGGGIFVRWNTQVTGNNLNIYGNTSAALGGGMRLWGGSAILTNTNIYSNGALSGAGVHGEYYSGYAPTLDLQSYADVYENQALTGDGLGGGVYMSEGAVLVADCSDLYLNDAIRGGGAYLVSSTLTMGGDCSEVMVNTATGDGGGIYALNSTINLDDQAELYDNDAGYGGGAGSGGGAYLDNSTLWGDNGLIDYNTANNFGGGVFALNDSLLDMDLGGYPCNGTRCSRLSFNTATTLYGGGVYANGSEIDLRQIFVESNTAYYGGGIYAYQGPVYLYNTLLARNNATNAVGDGVRLFGTASLTGSHNTLAHNNAGGATTGYAIEMDGDASLILSNTIVWGHTSSIDLAGQTVTCSDIQGGYAGTGIMNTDPLFIDAANSNFHLQSSSPVIDRCATGESRDFDNESRPVIYIRPTSPYDMGADEVARKTYLPLIMRY